MRSQAVAAVYEQASGAMGEEFFTRKAGFKHKITM